MFKCYLYALVTNKRFLDEIFKKQSTHRLHQRGLLTVRTKLPEKFMYVDYHSEDARQKEVVQPSSSPVPPSFQE